MNKISVLGLGYIGLPTSLVVAQHGYQVNGFDIDETKVARLNSGDAIIQEPEVYERLQNALLSGKFHASATLKEADFFIIAVPTPFVQNHDKNNLLQDYPKADLSFVIDATRRIANVLQKGNVVILESTVPVGTTAYIAQLLETTTGLQAGIDFFVAHCPERVLPGKIFHELIYNARIIGGINQESVNRAKEMYKPFVKAHLYLTDAATAEMVKLVENSSRDVQIAFAHQVASMASSVGLNPYEVIELANKHPRVNILRPTCGVGGHCIAVDPWFLIETFPHHTQLLKAARIVNDTKPQEVIVAIKETINIWQQEHRDRVPTVLLLGATYKPDVDDLRESPALHIAQMLQARPWVNLLIAEPHVPQIQLEQLVGKSVVSVEQGAVQADIIIYLVAHKNFKTVEMPSGKIILDFCGILHQERQIGDAQEQLFWPARGAFSNQQIMPTIQKHSMNNGKEYV